jgi:uncharacterized protein (DUF1800 family)
MRRAGSHAFLQAVVFLLTVCVRTGPIEAAPQSSYQQRCLNDLNRLGARVVKVQGRTNFLCVYDASRGRLDKLGDPALGQTQTAQACLTNDVRGRVATRKAKVTERDADRCLAAPEQMPSFGYTGAAAVNVAAQGASVGVMVDLFGANLDAALVLQANDLDGTRCQREVVKRANLVVDVLWSEAIRQKRNALRGIGRFSGPDPRAAVGSEVELRADLTLYTRADPRGRVARQVTKLAERTQLLCATVSPALGQLFPAQCGASAGPAELAACVEQLAKARFYASLAAFDALAIDCDFTDNGIADGSCDSPALKAHVLNRMGYGPDAWSWQRIGELGVAGYIQEQLDPAAIGDAAADALLAQIPSLTMTFQQLRTAYPQGGDPGPNQVRRELQQAKLLRAIASRRQLAEILFDMWFNHFNVDASSSLRTKYDISPYDRIAIRPHVLGTFHDLLLANARSPAMGDYLDNRLSKVNGINENYSRELLELHTLSVDGPYNENDVVEAARCLTGWREDYTNNVDGFRFQASWHDNGSKTLFGGALTIPAGGGEQDGINLIDYLTVQPATANFIVTKLVKRFVNEVPPASLVAEAAATYLATDGDVRAVMETILLSDDFLYDPLNRGSKVKRPHHLMASVARALGADPAQINLNALRRNGGSMGEDLYEAPPPTGYPDFSPFWTSPGTLVTRFNEVERRARGLDGFVFTYPVSGGTATQIVDGLAAQILPGGMSTDTRDVAIAFVEGLALPDAEKVQQAGAFLLSSPEFLAH